MVSLPLILSRLTVSGKFSCHPDFYSYTSFSSFGIKIEDLHVKILTTCLFSSYERPAQSKFHKSSSKKFANLKNLFSG